jgi:hypothetical protein
MRAGQTSPTSFKEVDECCEKPLGLVHSDLFRQFPVVAHGGGLHFVTFTDNCTRYSRVFILKNKESESLVKVFKEYQAWAEKQSGFKLMAI